MVVKWWDARVASTKLFPTTDTRCLHIFVMYEIFLQNQNHLHQDLYCE